MFSPRSKFQFAAVCITLFSLLAWFHSSHARHSVFEQRVGSRYIRYGGSSVALPDFNSVQAKVDIDEPADDPIWDTQNRTLGFQKIYAISMPHRSDKRDYLTLMALVSDLDVEFADGVDGSEMHPKAFPSFWKGPVGLGEYGVWRAHLNVYQHMVQNHVQSALIIEDDADWDILLKLQMLSFARGVRVLQNSVMPLHSPYGDSWNLLAIGHSGVNNKPNKPQKYYITPKDPTVISEARRIWTRKPDLSAEKLRGDYTRVVMEINKFTGTAAYGLSLRGAARLLYDQTMLPNAQAIDVAMSALCRHDDAWNEPFCLGAYPMIFGRYRATGPRDKDSDRRASSNEDNPGSGGFQDKTRRTKAESRLTVFPVSLNVGRLLRRENKFRANDPTQDMMKEIDLSTFEFPRGEVIIVQPEEYTERQEALRKIEKEKQQREKNGEVKGRL